ncbi:hypothetical protein KSP39_PZI012499 [Platanthera zijinensis]|uniref:Uncharacterized protein n=1 Tax=Platanthera zijinensis TaxID=2320716 RepID=A0AAP0BE52_9ASPA
MANVGANTNGSCFFICTEKNISAQKSSNLHLVEHRRLSPSPTAASSLAWLDLHLEPYR